MKIVQINANYNASSIGRTTSELHMWLLAHNHESYVFTSQDSMQFKNVETIGNKGDHKLHGFFSRLTGLQGYFSVKATRHLLRRLDEINPDIVHLRNLHANYINLPMLLRHIAKKGYGCVVTLHDCWIFTGHCCYYTKINCDRWLTQCYSCPLIKEDNKSWIFDFSRKSYSDKKKLFINIKNLAVLGNSCWTFEQAKRSFLKNSAIVDFIYNWIDRQVFYPRKTFDFWNKLGISDNQFVVLGVCEGWCKAKGLHVFVELAKRFSDIKFILVGGIAEEVNLPNNIIDVARTRNNDELCEYYSHANVLLNPSVQETFGKVSAEALCCGTPIIVNNATANPELVGEGCGYVVDDNNVAQYAHYIDIIRKHSKNNYSKACLEFATEHFDKERNIWMNIAVYKKLMNIKESNITEQ